MAVGTFISQMEQPVVSTVVKAAHAGTFFLHYFTILFSPFTASTHWALCNILDHTGSILQSWRISVSQPHAAEKIPNLILTEAKTKHNTGDQGRTQRGSLDKGFEILETLKLVGETPKSKTSRDNLMHRVGDLDRVVSGYLDKGFEILETLKKVNQETGDLLLTEFMVNMGSLVVVLLFHSSILVNFAGKW